MVLLQTSPESISSCYLVCVSTLFSFVSTGEPNDFEDGEHCSELYTSNGRWNDIPCERTMGYICKKDGELLQHIGAGDNGNGFQRNNCDHAVTNQFTALIIMTSSTNISAMSDHHQHDIHRGSHSRLLFHNHH